MPELAELRRRATGEWRQSARQWRNLLRDLRMPDFHVHAVDVPSPGAVDARIRSVWVRSCEMWIR